MAFPFSSIPQTGDRFTAVLKLQLVLSVFVFFFPLLRERKSTGETRNVQKDWRWPRLFPVWVHIRAPVVCPHLIFQRGVIVLSLRCFVHNPRIREVQELCLKCCRRTSFMNSSTSNCAYDNSSCRTVSSAGHGEYSYQQYSYQQSSYGEQGYDRSFDESSQHYYEGGSRRSFKKTF